MRSLIVAVVAAGALCALTANAQQVAAQAVSPDEQLTGQQDWIFGTDCDFDAVNGVVNRIVGFLSAGDMAWIQGFNVGEAGACGCIGGVDIQMYRTADNPTDMWEGREVTVYLWDDPTDDFDPTDAGPGLVGEANFIVPVGRGPMLITFDPVLVSGRFWAAGSIFANGIDQAGPPADWEFPAAFNNLIQNVDDESWLAYNEAEFDPNDLTAQLQPYPSPFRVYPIRLDLSECGGDPPCVPCDTNCDEVINSFDIEPFIALLFDENLPPCCGERGQEGSSGDTNGDGLVNGFDIEGFIDCLFGP